MLRKLTIDEIQSFSNRKNVKKIAVENFLMSMYDMTYEDAQGNVEMDAHLYKWNAQTVAAIRDGIWLASTPG
jgi:hypothetical protein